MTPASRRGIAAGGVWGGPYLRFFTKFAKDRQGWMALVGWSRVRLQGLAIGEWPAVSAYKAMPLLALRRRAYQKARPSSLVVLRYT